ncbi:MAG: TrbI/VirB10 family protein [Hyphomicrobiaceae bacterium]
MSDENDVVQERLQRLKPAPAVRKTPVWLWPVLTAVAGAVGGGYVIANLPERTEETAAQLQTSRSTEFQQNTGLEGFQIRRTQEDPVQRETVVVRDSAEVEKLEAMIAQLRQQIQTLQDNPEQVMVADEAAISRLSNELDELRAATQGKDNQIRDLENELVRLQTKIETDALLASQFDAEAEEEARRRQELERLRAEAEARNEAQIVSPMVAYRRGSSSSESDGEERRYTGDEAFVRAGAKRAEVTRSEVIGEPANTILQGTLIEATLETGISSDLSGTIVAIISYDVWSADMSQVLIPRGSKLVGRYSNGVKIGQKRVLMAWDRLITTDLQSVELDAYGADRLGRSGMPGRVNSHFLERFGSAALISVIGAVPDVIADNVSNETFDEIAEEVSEDFSGAVDNVLAEYLSIAPTITVDQGDIVMVRVNTDLEIF